MFCSTNSSFLRISLFLSSPTRNLADIMFNWSVNPLMSGAGGGVFCENMPFFAGSGVGGVRISFAMVNVYILLWVHFLL